MKRSLFGAVALAAVALSVVFISAAGAAKPPPAPPPATSSGGCPNGSLANYPTSGIVGYSVTNDAGNATSTYKFFSQNQNPTGGVPGLQGYCVYTATAPKSDTTTGGDFPAWKASKPGTSFGFTRPGGEPTNIPLDGKTDTVGSATWAKGKAPAPAAQQILLHLSGAAAAVCNGLPSCYVRPTLPAGPICNVGTGNTNAAYNDIPTDVTHCGPPSEAFQGNSTSEFGDVVGLSNTAGSHTVSMTVDFQSYACETGNWNTDDCSTTPGDAFHIPTSGTDLAGIRANLYEVGPPDSNGNPMLGSLIATANEDPAIPYRPSKDDTNCTGGEAGEWYDAVAEKCRNSISDPVTFTDFTFTDPGYTFTANQKVIWTVAFNTESYGSNPIGSDGPWDSLNVGTMTYYPGNTPFAGTEVDPASAFVNAASSQFYCHDDTPIDVLRIDTISNGAGPCTSPQYSSQTSAWTGLKPLGEIVLGP